MQLSKKENANHKEFFRRINREFYRVLDEKNNHMTVQIETHTCEFFVVGHTGYWGVKNREKYTKLGSKEILKYDWENIGSYL